MRNLISEAFPHYEALPAMHCAAPVRPIVTPPAKPEFTIAPQQQQDVSKLPARVQMDAATRAHVNSAAFQAQLD